MPKVMTILGTRPEIIKMSRVIAEFDRHTKHILVHTGQNYNFELNQIFFEDLEIRKPDYFLNAAEEGAAKTIAKVIEKSDAVMESEKPDAILLYGDTNSCLAVIAAKRRKIPVFHMEAGNRCFDQRVPEELNRKVVDHLSDFNLVLTEHARRNLIAEGISAKGIIKTGSHMKEVLDYYSPKINSSNVLSRMGLNSKEYFLVSLHREENTDDLLKVAELVMTVESVSEKYNKPVIVSTHPRIEKQLISLGVAEKKSQIFFAKPFGFCDYITLQKNALCVLSDSGTIFEESSLLNFPAITIRESHERPEGMDEGILIMSGRNHEQVLSAIHVTLSQHKKSDVFNGLVQDYMASAVSRKVLRAVLSNIDYVNRTTWFR